VLTEGAAIRQAVQNAQQAGQTVGLVPTMGALHEGHLSLVDASKAECDQTVVSIFVNPTQFSPEEDLETYPRSLESDLKLLTDRGCDFVFVPSVEEMIPPCYETFVDVGSIAEPLEGEFRPGHFRGVATVVLKLFQMVPADRAYFGQKDYQQTLVVKKLVDDLSVPTDIRVCPILREPDGLAMSSRNVRLSEPERQQARALSQSLELAKKLVAEGERDTGVLYQKMRERIEQAGGVEMQYIGFVAEGTVTPVYKIIGPTVVLLAAQVGETRLIDNILVG